MTQNITIELPESAFSLFKVPPSLMAKEIINAAVVKWYETGLVSQSKASEIAGISRQEFIDLLIRYKVTPFQTSPEEIKEELLCG